MKDTWLFHLMNAVLAAAVGVVLYYDPRTAVQLMALIGVTWLAMLLIVPRLYYSQRFKKWHPELERIAKLSKYVGLWVAAWFVAHGMTATLTHYGVPQNIFTYAKEFSLSKQIILGGISLCILLLLAAMSNKWSYTHIKWWKQLNMLVWMLPGMIIAHALMASHAFLHEGPLFYIAPVLMGLAIVAGYDALFAKEKRLTDKLRLAYVTGGIAAAALVVLAIPG